MPAELGFLGPLISVAKVIGGWAVQRFKKPDPVSVLESRAKWRADFQAHLLGRDASGTRGDSIIRDVKRIDKYPELDGKSRGISPWFKVELKGIYHRGVEVFLRVEPLVFVEEHNGWRFGKYDEAGAVNALLTGRIPFDVVRSVDWEGDEFYPYPHLYCDFAKRNGQPYEDLVFYVAHEGTTGPYFMELGKLEAVKKLSKNLGVERWG
jgi:hypothetical protein